MARKQATLLAAGVLAAFALGLLLGRFSAPREGDPNSQPIAAAEQGAGQRA